jgi:molybdopterin-guanine dinucleotide biosynthesis protein A
MTRPAPLLGAVLAGGTSRRLGRDKASASIGDSRLIDRAIDALSGVCDHIVVVSSREDTPDGPWTQVGDLRPPCGPLGGIESALDAALRHDCLAVFVLACDLPLVDSGVVESVLAGLGSASAAAPRRDGVPDLEPLCAVYRSSCLDQATELLDGGVRAAQALFDEVGGVRVEIDREFFLNVNTEGDLDRASAVLRLPRDGA